MDGARALTQRHFGTQTFWGASETFTQVLSRPGQSISPSHVCVHIPIVPPFLKMQKSVLHSALSLHCAPNSFFVPPLEELEELDEVVPLDEPPLELDELVPLDDPPLEEPSSLPLHPAKAADVRTSATPNTLRMTYVSSEEHGVRRRPRDDAARAGA